MALSFHYHKKCNICGSKSRVIIVKLHDQNLARCKKCKIYFLDKQRKDLENLYDTNYYSVELETTGANYCNYEVQEKLIKKNYKFAYNYLIEKYKRKKINLLEIGAGYGYFPKYLPKNIDYEAIEISDEAIKIIKKNYKAFKGDFMKLRFKKKYDVIVAFDVIEHQIFLKEFFNKVHASMRPGGVFILTTPDFESVLNKLFRKKAPTIQPNYHNYYFDKEWLKNNAPLFGFNIISIRTVYFAYLSIGQILLLGSFAIPFLKKLRITSIAHALKIEDVIVPFFRFGGIECILRKA